MMRFGFIVLLFVLALPFSARADETQKQLYVPTSGWLVGPASLVPGSGEETRVPCIMMNQYDNGYTFRFSGGGRRLLAAAIDFRQSAFTVGSRYPLTLQISPTYSKNVDGIAYNDSVLLITASNGEEAANLYSAMLEGKELQLGLGKKLMDFALLGAADGLRRIEECYSPSPMKQLQHNEAAQNSAMPEKPERALPPEPTIDPDPAHAAPIAMPNVDSVVGKAAADINRTMGMPAQPAVSSVSNAAQKPVDKAVDSAMTSTVWEAVRGASLHDTLDVWAARENIRLDWGASHSFPVRETLRIDGSFQQAVQSLFGQYANEKNRPVEKFYIDPAKKTSVLMVREEGP